MIKPLKIAGGEGSGGVEMPSYMGALRPVEGLSRSVEAHTDEELPSRYDFVSYEVVEGDTIWGIAESLRFAAGNYSVVQFRDLE